MYCDNGQVNIVPRTGILMIDMWNFMYYLQVARED